MTTYKGPILNGPKKGNIMVYSYPVVHVPVKLKLQPTLSNIAEHATCEPFPVRTYRWDYEHEGWRFEE